MGVAGCGWVWLVVQTRQGVGPGLQTVGVAVRVRSDVVGHAVCRVLGAGPRNKVGAKQAPVDYRVEVCGLELNRGSLCVSTPAAEQIDLSQILGSKLHLHTVQVRGLGECA